MLSRDDIYVSRIDLIFHPKLGEQQRYRRMSFNTNPLLDTRAAETSFLVVNTFESRKERINGMKSFHFKASPSVTTIFYYIYSRLEVQSLGQRTNNYHYPII